MRAEGVALFFVLGLLACGDDGGASPAPDAPNDAPQRHELKVVIAGGGVGNVTSSPAGIACGGDCADSFAPGTSVSLTATANTGSTFTGWSGGGCTGTGPCTVVVSADVEVTAMIVPNHTFVIVKNGAGTGGVTSSPAGIDCGSDCSETFAPGTSVTLTAAPTGSSTFTGWSGACAGTTTTCTVTANAAVGVVATFGQAQHTLTVLKDGTGSGTVASSPPAIDCGPDCTERAGEGTMITLTATPAADSTFAGWTGGGCSGTGTCDVTLAAATTVTATFTRIPHTVSVTTSGPGRVVSVPAGIDCGSDCSATFGQGTTVTLIATPDAGANFLGWSGACTGTALCVVDVDMAASVQARFEGCDGFDRPDGTTISNWTERVGDWVIDGQRLRNTVAGNGYGSVITKDASMFTDGCVRLSADHVGTPSTQAAGAVLRWTASGYIVAVVQDNTNAGNFNSLWVYEYPGLNELYGGAGLSLGTNPNLEACVNGSTVTVRVDANRDGTYETSESRTTNISGPGLAGVTTHSFQATAASAPRVDNVCWY